MNAPDKAVAFEALMKDTPALITMTAATMESFLNAGIAVSIIPYGNISPAYSRNAHIALPNSPQRR